MPKYTRRHYQDFAGMISKMPAQKRRAEVERLSPMFARDNPRFDKRRFSEASGVKGSIRRMRR